MNKIIIISDVHGNYDFFKELIETYKTDTFILLGDYVGYSNKKSETKTLNSVRMLEKLKNFYVIYGNNDSNFYNDYTIRAFEELPQKKEFIIFGKRFFLSHSIENLDWKQGQSKSRIKNYFSHNRKKRYDYFLFGHVHYQFYYKVKDEVILNPGALMNCEYAILEMDQKIDFYRQEKIVLTKFI